MFNSFTNGLITTGNNPNYFSVWHAVGWRNFTGIYNSQPSTGTCTDVKQPTPSFHFRHDNLHQLFNLWNYFFNSIWNTLILTIDVRQQLTCAHLFKMLVV